MIRRFVLGAALSAALPVAAQQPPDAGRTLKETAPPTLTAPRPAPDVTVAPPADKTVAAGGQKVRIDTVRLSGNTVFTEAELLAVLGEVAGEYDLAGLEQLARRLTEHYRRRGYPFARAFVPAQKLAAGALGIKIVEGRYGKVEARGDMADQAQAFLSDLEPGKVIAGPVLERAALILADQPGIRVSPLLRPGQEIGAGDLLVEVARERLFKSELGFDNHGNRYTGQYRARAQLRADSPFVLGDQFLGRLLLTNEGLWLGSIGYSRPLGARGLRGSIGYSHTYYELGEDFASLDAHGTAKVTSLGLSYPLLRSQRANLTLAASFEHKDLEDRQDAVAIRNAKKSQVLPIVLQFDRRDGQGLSWGALALTSGDLDLDAALTAVDQASGADTRGRFTKWNLDLARLQTTPWPALKLFGRASLQWANKNLDSSESFLLGGASGVRAYPQGEGNGDEGWLAQIEARLRVGGTEPFLFVDAGEVRVNARPGSLVPPVTDNTRRLGGAGVGVRAHHGPWSLDAALAWRTQGGRPESDTEDRNPRAWLSLARRY